MAKGKVTLISFSSSPVETGLRNISSLLKTNGFIVEIIFLRKRFEESVPADIIDQIAGMCKDSIFVGMSVMTNYVLMARHLTGELKKRTGVPVVWGGIHPSLRPQESLQFADIACVGEGERPSLELANRLKGSKTPEDIPNICFKKADRQIIVESSYLCEDLNTLPFPDYDISRHYVISENKIIKADLSFIGRTYNVFPQRGCPYACTYCGNYALRKAVKFHKGYFRRRRVTSVMQEISEIISQYPQIKNIAVNADEFLSMPVEDINTFCDLYKKNINLPFSISASPQNVSDEKISKLVDAGLDYVFMGIETGSERTKKLYARLFASNGQILEAARVLNRYKKKLRPSYDFIVDNPWETDKDLIETLRLYLSLPAPHNVLIFSLTFFPGTSIYQKAFDEGLIKDDEKDIYTKFIYDTKSSYFNSLFYLFLFLKNLNVPISFSKKLLDAHIINSTVFFPFRLLIANSTKMLKALYLFKFIVHAFRAGDMAMLKNYIVLARNQVFKFFKSPIKRLEARQS